MYSDVVLTLRAFLWTVSDDVESHRYAYRIAIKPCWSSPDTIVCMYMPCSFEVFGATKVFVSHSMTTSIYVLNRSRAHEQYLYGVSVMMAQCRG